MTISARQKENKKFSVMSKERAAAASRDTIRQLVLYAMKKHGKTASDLSAETGIPINKIHQFLQAMKKKNIEERNVIPEQLAHAMGYHFVLKAYRVQSSGPGHPLAAKTLEGEGSPMDESGKTTVDLRSAAALDTEAGGEEDDFERDMRAES